MKFAHFNKISKQIFSATIVTFIIFTFLSCSRKIAFSTSSVVPAAEGSVKIKKDNNNNYKIKLSMIRLAEPKRLNPPKDFYIVWMETDRNGIKNIGKLETSSGFLSKTLKSSLETVTTFKPTRFFITAEDKPNIQYPSRQEVMRTASF